MKIAFDNQMFSIQAYGGVSRYFVSLSRHLNELGEEARIFAPYHKNRYLAGQPDSGVYLQNYPYKMARFYQAYSRLRCRTLIKQWKPDIVHETYFSRFRSAPRNYRSVLTVHDMIHELYPEKFSWREKSIAAKRAAVSRVDHVLCISENTRNDLLNIYGIDDSRVSVVYHGFDPFDGAVKDGRMPRPYILHVGQRGGYKNFERLVRAFASSNRLSSDFCLVAFGGGKFSKQELDLFSAQNLPEDSYCQISGDDGLLGGLYRNAVCFVYPSLYEGFGLPPLEAMSASCPVISSNTSSMPEVIGDAAEFFDPASVDSIRWAIEKVVYSEDRRAALVARGQERIKLFSWKKCAEQTRDVYRRCL